MSQVIHGYYRWTDIFFEWEKAISMDDHDAFKASLNSFALVHPDHPLRVKGESGLRVYIGAMTDGEQRLLMKTEQADYIRQWLHSVGLTETILPLPGSEFILTESTFPFITQELFDDASMFKATQKAIQKHNKQLRDSGVAFTIEERLAQLEQVRSLWQTGIGTWCAMDFEHWEQDHTVMTEFGWASVCAQYGEDIRDQGHCIVRYGGPGTTYRNGTYVEDNQENYQFGESQRLSRPKVKHLIAGLITRAIDNGPLFLVFHDARGDIKSLTDIGAPVEGATKVLPGALPVEGIFIIDTAPLFAGLAGEKQLVSLDRMCSRLGLQPDYMHNAGNDAYWTLAALESMASGETVSVSHAGWV